MKTITRRRLVVGAGALAGAGVISLASRKVEASEPWQTSREQAWRDYLALAYLSWLDGERCLLAHEVGLVTDGGHYLVPHNIEAVNNHFHRHQTMPSGRAAAVLAAAGVQL